MRMSHKRNVQRKLNKTMKVTTSAVVKADAKPIAKAKPVAKAKPIAQEKVAKPVKAEAPAKATSTPVEANTLSLTAKQQQVLDIVRNYAEGINPKGIGLDAGQEDAKAASWATAALKKLAEEGLVERIQLAGNKVLYKAA
uniref:MarR family transcriptional regulator n=1 Tax=Thaumasiovibrio occultus TaxID=1891184 RepID=UPI000B360380|nr:MarR family transcriptional regulator [Thaumasiovibrio occultus]